ncbi:site-specific integrase [Nocardia vinacea]|uniref:Site-specific integrase n=1 Tax=Nocardia vinacea TaxID=96468 RepID=A0ABZ1YTX0_9NOCA|nr:site-specific integrase [Nocardia vinacea]
MIWSRNALIFPQTHRLLGWLQCAVTNCDQKAATTCGLCASCFLRWKKNDRPQIAEFVLTERVRVRDWMAGPCSVPDCARQWRTRSAALCQAHDYTRRLQRLTVAELVAHPETVGYPAFGPCSVAACTRYRDSSGPYCETHAHRWATFRRRTDPAQHDEPRWRTSQPAVAVGGEVSLRGLPDRVVAELLFGLQQRTADGSKTKVSFFRCLADHVRAQGIACLEEVAFDGLILEVSTLARQFVTAARRLRSDPESERHKDVWDTTVFGFSGTLRFDAISQAWLRDAAKVMAYNDLPRQRGKGGKQHCQCRINYLALLSESLRLQRRDHGSDPAALARDDVTAFLNRMAFLQAEGGLSEKKRIRVVREVRRLLGEMRALGLTRAGQPMYGLPDDFSLREGDAPDEPEDNAAGRDLPTEVIRHLCERLDLLETLTSPEIRAAVELLIDTGRRPDEICQLGLDCLDREGQGKPILVYDNLEANRMRRRLPIQEATAAVIERQQRRVRARFADEPASRLKLLPTSIKNPHGIKAINDGHLGARHRDWITALPDTSVPMTVVVNGKTVVKLVPFDKSRIIPYAYRHTYAQRHADAGVAVDVLRELMDHLHLVTTQGYYRVGEKRRRDAVDRVTTMQFDRHGIRVWRQAQALLDDEHLRRAVGEVAVPYGSCSEPSNVAAGGDDCPVRFRCVGCAHLSTDVSYLPDLEAYLADLMRSRERLRSVIADDWAKTEATPSGEEITRIRRLISRVKADVDDLSVEDRAQFEESVAIVRRARNRVVGLGTPRIRQPVPDIRPDRSA